MPSGMTNIDQRFPQFKGSETQEQKLRMILDYLYMLREYLQYVLNNLTPDNFNATALDGLIDEIRAGVVVADVVISNTTITNNLYATYGDISELTVDRLLTLNKVEKYWAGDTDEVNYIKVQDQTYQAVTGTTDGSTTQLTDRDGNLLYYKGPVTALTYKTVGISTTPTAYPVTVYDYDELVKMTIGHVYDSVSGYWLPQIIMGAGSGTGDNGKFFITKTAAGLSMTYHTTGGEDTTLTFGDYVDAKHRRLKSAAIDKTLGEITVLMEGQTAGDEEVIEFTETATSMTFTWPDAFVCTVSIS